MVHENAKRIKALTELVEKDAGNGKCLIGFDGYVDELYSVVSRRLDGEHYEPYQTIEDFGKRILSAAGKSADIEICSRRVQFGGNAPIMANAMASLDYNTTCLGKMDLEGKENPFSHMNPKCTRISTGPASRTIAMEFRDGKIMLGDLQGNHTGWEKIRDTVGWERLCRLVKESRIIGMVNWGGMYRMNEIMERMLEEILLPLPVELRQEKELFLDLADPSGRSKKDLDRLFGVIARLAKDFRVTVGMNENEVYRIGEQLGCRQEDMRNNGERIRASLGLYRLVVHTNRRVYGFMEGSMEEYAGMHVEDPVMTTGAGDHFNAGFCMGIMEGGSLYESLVLGQAMASCYISTGMTPDRVRLADYIRQNYRSAA